MTNTMATMMSTMKLLTRSAQLILICALSAGPANAAANAQVNTASISDPGSEWLSYGRDYSEQRFSPLTDINTQNVDQLGLQWSYRLPTARVMESTPLVHKGVMYLTTSWSRVYALDARNGELLWEYDPGVDKAHLLNSCCGPANRGVALWTAEDGKTRIYLGSFDGRLIALDADSGSELWSVQTVPEKSHYTVTGAPRVAAGKVIIGNGGAELGARGYVSAYDAVSGEMSWRFYTVPGNPAQAQESDALEKAVSTWKGQWWEIGGGGGTVWDAIVYDPELDLLYIGTGNGSPWNREIRSPGGGDNLYLSSIVALRPDTGKYVWHYQVTPGENWDYTATQHLILADLDIAGTTRQVIMQAPKNGFFYVLDRNTGELLSAEAYAQVNWASHIDMKTGRPVEEEVASYQKTGGSLLWPAPFGAHNWQPMSYSQQTGLVYIPVQHIAGYYSSDEKFSFTEHRWNTGVDFWGMRGHEDPLIARANVDAIARGYLTAWDPVKQREVWKVQHKKASNGGILSSAGGLVFQGTGEGGFHAYDAVDGERLWSFQSDSAVLAGPITYSVDGDQYVAVTQGSGGAVMLTLGLRKQVKIGNPNRVLVFKLNPKNPQTLVSGLTVAGPLPIQGATHFDTEQLLEGEKIYERTCAACHGLTVEGNGVIPDLRYMSAQTQSEFQAIVLGGLRAHKGMAGFYETMTFEQATALQNYISSRSQRLQETEEWGWWDTLRYWWWYWMSRLGDAFPALANLTRDSIMGE